MTIYIAICTGTLIYSTFNYIFSDLEIFKALIDNNNNFVMFDEVSFNQRIFRIVL